MLFVDVERGRAEGMALARELEDTTKVMDSPENNSGESDIQRNLMDEDVPEYSEEN
jgi:hypothetical protein